MGTHGDGRRGWAGDARAGGADGDADARLMRAGRAGGWGGAGGRAVQAARTRAAA
jgi:hypothetical protein